MEEDVAMNLKELKCDLRRALGTITSAFGTKSHNGALSHEQISLEVTDESHGLLPTAHGCTRGSVLLNAGIERTVTLPGGVDMIFRYCPPGEFMMGCHPGEEAQRPCGTRHRVQLTHGFWMGKYQVTQSQWKSCMGANPSKTFGWQHPVENISWEDCQEFIHRLSSCLCLPIRLPTEAEWEYACRAGTKGKRYGILGDVAWWVQNSKGHTHPVGMKLANAWGFHDMIGNVREWCSDWYAEYSGDFLIDPSGPLSGTVRIQRGGGMDDWVFACRASCRSTGYPFYRDGNTGLRLCLTADDSQGDRWRTDRFSHIWTEDKRTPTI